MKSIRIAAFALAAVSAIAIAQAPPVAHTHGRGVAANADGVRGEFGFEANKWVRDGAAPVVRGTVNFAVMNPTSNAPGVHIESRGIARLGVNGAVAEFGGRGILVRRTPTGPIRIEGMVSVRVEDLHRPDGSDTNKDKFAIRFLRPRPNADPEVVFQYAGDVQRGDLVVRAAP